MIGFDAIGRSAIGELSGGEDVVIFAPVVLDVTAALGGAPEVHGGGSALPPGTVVSVAVDAPLIAVGASVITSSIAVVVSNGSAFIAQSATVTALANDVAVASLPPSILGGASVTASSEVTVTASAAVILAGVRIDAPFVSVASISAPAMVSGGTIVTVPVASVVASSTPIDILGGNYIEASNTVTMITPYGEIGSASIGEFAVGEGEPSTRLAKRGVLVRVGVEAPEILAGKTIYPPFANINVSSSPIEVDSRLRRIRVYAIAS